MAQLHKLMLVATTALVSFTSGTRFRTPIRSLSVSLDGDFASESFLNSSDVVSLLAKSSGADPCQCAWKGQCGCDGAIEFMSCVEAACDHKKCDCSGSKLFDGACNQMADLCPKMGLKCGSGKATCGSQTVSLDDAAPKAEAEKEAPAPVVDKEEKKKSEFSGGMLYTLIAMIVVGVFVYGFYRAPKAAPVERQPESL